MLINQKGFAPILIIIAVLIVSGLVAVGGNTIESQLNTNTKLNQIQNSNEATPSSKVAEATPTAQKNNEAVFLTSTPSSTIIPTKIATSPIPLPSQKANFDPNANESNTFVSKDGRISFSWPSVLEKRPGYEYISGNHLYSIEIQSKGWNYTQIGQPDTYKIAMLYFLDKPWTPEQFMNFDNVETEKIPKGDYEQTKINGQAVIIETLNFSQKIPSFGIERKYYFYKGNYGILLSGSGQKHEYLEQVVNSLKFAN